MTSHSRAWKLALATALFATVPTAASALGPSPSSARVSSPAAARPCDPIAHVAKSVSFGRPKWTVCVGSTITQSSPSVATWNGTTIIAIGDEDGYVHLLNAATGEELPGWPQRMKGPLGTPLAVESSPTIAFLDGPDASPSVIVGSASTWVKNKIGEVEAFKFDGAKRFDFHVGAASNTSVGVISTPAVGDIIGNGQLQIAFGAWDHHIYVLDTSGHQVGFAYDTADTVWSSPTLVKQPGQPGSDIVLGSDASGRTTQGVPGGRCFGGFIADYRFIPSATNPDTLKSGPGLTRIWFHCLNQSVWSSPSIATVNHQAVIFVGTSFFEQPFPSDTDRLFAFYARSGATVPGWPVTTPGPILGSAAIGTLSTGMQGVVATSFICGNGTRSSCSTTGHSEVLAWTMSGRELWRDTIPGPTAFGSPTLVPLEGETSNDVIVSTTNGMYPLRGATGTPLFGTNLSNQYAAINPGCRSFSTPAVAQVSSDGVDEGWMVVESCGGPPAFHVAGEITTYRLPTQPIETPGWPMFRGSSQHTGQAPRSEPIVPIPA